MGNRERQYSITIGLTLTALALALRLHGLGWGLPEVYEEATPLRKAWAMWNAGATPFDPNPHFFNYPSLVIYLHLLWQGLQFAVFRFTGLITSNLDFRMLVEVEKTPVFYAARLLTALFGAGTVWLVFQLGRRLAGLVAGTAAAFLLAVNTFHIDQSQLIAVDVPLTFFSTAALLAMMRLGPAARLRDHVGTGVLIGLATSAKYTGAALVIPYLAALVFSEGTPHKRWRPLLIGLAAAAMVFALTSPFVVLDSKAAWHSIGVERYHMHEGHFGLGADSAWYHYFIRLAGSLPGWPILLLGVLGVWHCGRHRRWGMVAVPLAFLVVNLGPISTWTMKADRYLIPVIPILMVLAGCGIGSLVQLAEQRGWARRTILAGAATITLLSAVPSALAYPSLLVRSRPDTRTTSLRWIEEHVPAGAFILSEYFGPELLRPTTLLPLDEALQNQLLNGQGGRPVYAVQLLPLFQARPVMSAVYYDLNRYPDADYILISGSVRSRYAKDPRQFARQLAFYAAVQNQWEHVRDFAPGNGSGPRLQLFHNPRWELPYAQRPISAPLPLPPTAGPLQDGGFHFFSLGANAMSFHHSVQAEQAFRLGLQYRYLRPEIALNLVLGAVTVIESDRGAAQATAFLDSIAAENRPELRRAIAQVRGGTP